MHRGIVARRGVPEAWRVTWTVGGVIGLSFVGLGVESARAQQAAAPAQTTAPAAQTTKSGELEEIVVTAQRRTERLQDVPITVTAVSADQLATAGINNVQDLKTLVPGLSVGNAVGFAVTHLRGVGSTAIAPGVETPVAIYVDGVYYASTMSSFLDFIDVDNVEVLKGPQGTLFGRNATGGLIQVTTKQPTQELGIDADVTYGNYNAGKGSFYITGGITDTLAADFAIQGGAQGDGYGTNLLTGHDALRADLDLDARSKWVWTPSDATSVTAEFDYDKQRNDFNGGRLPPGASNLPGLATPVYGSPWDINENIDPIFINQGGGGSVRLEQDLGFAHLMDLASFRMDHSSTHWSLYQSALPFFDGLLETQERQMSEEMQLSSLKDSPLIWTGGLFYFNYNSAYDPNHAKWGPAPPNDEVIPGIADVLAPDVQLAQSFAAYGQATATVLPQTNLTLGVRYTLEKHELHGDTLLVADNGDVAVHIPTAQESKTFEKPTYRVAIDHHLDEDTLLYVSVNSGFKSGGYNTGSISDPPYQPEKLTAYEIGVKSDLFEHKLRLDLSGFHYDYTNIQVQKIEGGNTGIINGGAAQVNGVDLDFQAKVIQNFTITGSGEYLDASFTSFPNAPISNSNLGLTTGVVTGSATGNQLPYVSHFSFSLGGNYVVDLPDSSLNFNVTLNHVGSFYLEPDNVMKQPAYTKVNSSVEWSPNSGMYSVKLWGTNLTDEAVFTYGGTLVSGLHTVQYEPPRTYGITLAYHFASSPASAPMAQPVAPPPQVEAPPPVRQPEAQRNFQVFFDFDKSDMTEAAAQVIEAAATVAKTGGVVHITVTGHTDTVGTAKYNQALSERRATAVKQQLIADGIGGGEITSVGVGKTGLLVPTKDGVREPQNRRAEIVLQ